MGGSQATDNLEKGHLTQTWLAVSDDPAARFSGGYWFHRERREPAPEVKDARFQDELMAKLAELSGVKVF
jgi:hypothetical protein